MDLSHSTWKQLKSFTSPGEIWGKESFAGFFYCATFSYFRAIKKVREKSREWLQFLTFSNLPFPRQEAPFLAGLRSDRRSWKVATPCWERNENYWLCWRDIERWCYTNSQPWRNSLMIIAKRREAKLTAFPKFAYKSRFNRTMKLVIELSLTDNRTLIIGKYGTLSERHQWHYPGIE